MAVSAEQKAYFESQISQKMNVKDNLLRVIEECDNVLAKIDKTTSSTEEVILAGKPIGSDTMEQVISQCNSVRRNAVEAYNSCVNEIRGLQADLNALLHQNS